MVNYRDINKRIVNEVRNTILKDNTLQIINGADLHKIPETQLKFPRLIVEFVNYNDSDYDYTKSEYNSSEDVVKFEIEKIPRLTYRFRAYNDSSNNQDILVILSKIHTFYSNPYQYKLNGDIQIIATDSILQISSGVEYDYTLGFQFTMDFNMSEKFIMDIDFATSIEATLNVKSDDDKIQTDIIKVP
ncbi:MAG: hypothetical protein ACRCX2_08105 [Paraclostridium sp.]